MPTASQMIAALIRKFCPDGKVSLTHAELYQFQTKWPTRVEWDGDDEITLTIDPESFRTNEKLRDVD